MKELPARTVEDRIRDHYINGTELSGEDNRIKERLVAAHAMLLGEYENDANISKMLQGRFEISRRQSYIDIFNCKNIFGEMRNSSKEGMRYIVTQMCMDLIRAAKKTNNLKAWEKALERLTKVNNLDKEDPDMPDPSKIQPPIQLMMIDFEFMKSPMFKKLDVTTQQVLIKQYHEVMDAIKLSPLADYSDMFLIEDIEHAEID